MKYEIIKGSEKDFDGAPELALVKIQYKDDEDDFVFAEKFELAAKFWYVDGALGSLNGYYNHGTIIAERRPITEPELKPIYGDGIHDDSDALQQRIDMGIDVSNIIGEQGKLFNISRPLQFNPITEPVWDGEGLMPSVGMKCLAKQCSQINADEFLVVAIQDGAVFGFWTATGAATGLDVNRWIFLPIRSPEDVARSNAIGEMERAYEELTGNPAREAEEYYDLIAAGKIKCVKLEGK